MNFTSHTKTFSNKLRVHALSTGVVAVKKRFRDARFRGILAQLDFLLDRSFTEWMPIWVWVIEHPEGIFVIDTGENAEVNTPAYFRPAGRFNEWLNTTQFRFEVKREDEIDVKMEALGLDIKAVKQVILTHLHLDHVDGLKHFTQIPTVVNRLEWKKPFGDLPHLYPEGFQPNLLDLDQSYGPFEHARRLTRSGDLILVQTPGHTYYHCSVFLETPEGLICFAADVCYNQDQLLENRHSGADVNPSQSHKTYELIRELARSQPLVLLPSHDAQAGKRLEEMEVFNPS